MSWSYHDIDLFVSTRPNVLDETVISTDSWITISTYGLMRGRPTITPAVNNAQKTTIPGKPGELYPIIDQRSNAQISFEILVGDIWPHAALKQLQDPNLNNVYNRTWYVKSILDDAKRISYKEQGKSADDYYEVRSVKCEISDADEKAAVIKCTMDVFPFRYKLDGNGAIQINANYDTKMNQTFVMRPYSDAWPIFVLGPYNLASFTTDFRVLCSDGEATAQQLGADGNRLTVRTENLAAFGTAISGKTLIIDTGNLQAYDSQSNPMNRFLVGDYDALRFTKGKYISILNSSAVPMKVYTRRGMNL